MQVQRNAIMWQAELAPMQDDEDVKRHREENGHVNGHFQVYRWDLS